MRGLYGQTKPYCGASFVSATTCSHGGHELRSELWLQVGRQAGMSQNVANAIGRVVRLSHCQLFDFFQGPHQVMYGSLGVGIGLIADRSYRILSHSASFGRALRRLCASDRLRRLRADGLRRACGVQRCSGSARRIPREPTRGADMGAAESANLTTILGALLSEPALKFIPSSRDIGEAL
jgi:hypothetical protein